MPGFKKPLSPAVSIAGTFFVLLWLPYVIFSEYLVRALCDTRLPVEQSLELTDAAVLTFVIFSALLTLLLSAIFVSLKSLRASRKEAPQTLPARGNTKGRIAAFIILTVLLCLMVFFLVWYARFHGYVRSLDGYKQRNAPSYREPDTPSVAPADLLNLGWAHTKEIHPEYSYILFPREKKPGTIRVGIFGCSFVFGMETAKGNEFPTFLQRKFKEGGFSNVEVINFGVSGYGMHQSYLLWKAAGIRYDLDYAVFLPLEIHESRDRTFIFNNREYLPLHGRFIAERGDLKLVGVAGDSLLDATMRYFRFFPPWRYLRYDEKAPVSLYALDSAKSGELENPFYYRDKKERKKEILDTYALIFNRLGSEARNAIIIAEEEDMRGLEKQVSSPHLTFLRGWAPHVRDSFLYHAPIGHHSALGHRLQADELFDFLTGGEKPTFDHLKIERDEQEAPGQWQARPLHEYQKIMVAIEGSPVAHFGLPTETNSAYNEPRCKRLLDFQKMGICSLVLQTDGTTVRFVPLPFIVKNDEPLSFRIRSGDYTENMPIGKVRAKGGVIGRALMDSRTYSWPDGSWKLSGSAEFNSQELPESLILKGCNERVDQVSVTIGDKIFLKGKEIPIHRLINALRKVFFFRRPTLIVYHYRLEPVMGEYSYLKAGPGEYTDIRGPGERSGSVDLLLTDEKGSTEEIPLFLRYRYRQVHGPLFHEKLKNHI
ncbi:MAG: hypothetical protein RDV48_05750 [Candidatus Eremiobacteraeota bacterium]|nr:hypothetical protein [Candidatus Eremiobacteraeota bacterium]